PQRASSEKTTRSAAPDFASPAICSMRAEFPGKSPTVGLNWARAIFMANVQHTKAEGNLQTARAARDGRGKPRPYEGEPKSSSLTAVSTRRDRVRDDNVTETLSQPHSRRPW